MPHPIMFRDDDLGLAEVRKIAWASPRRSRRSPGAGRCSARRRCSSCTAAAPRPTSRGEYLQYPYSILVKVDESDRKALEQDSRFFYPAYMGPSGWLGLDFTARKKVDWDEVRELVDASFRLVAPKKLIKQLDEV